MSNGILIGLTDQGKTCVTKYYKSIVFLINYFMKNIFEIMIRWCLTYDAVYSSSRYSSSSRERCKHRRKSKKKRSRKSRSHKRDSHAKKRKRRSPSPTSTSSRSSRRSRSKKRSRAQSHDRSSSSETRSPRNQDRNTTPVNANGIHAPDGFCSKDEGQQDNLSVDDPCLGNDEDKVNFASLVDEVYNLLPSDRFPRMPPVAKTCI